MRLRLIAILFLCTSSGLFAQENWNPVADSAAIVESESGYARFTVLTPGLVRMEWAADGKFEDRASQFVVNRRLPVPKFTAGEQGGRLILKTDRLEIRYKKAFGRFDKGNLTIVAKVGPGEKTVELSPPFENHGNLGGTTRTLDGVNGSCPLEDGLLSREGWTLVDDSKRLVFTDGDPPWIAAREKKDAIDWYIFVYGHDYKGALGDFIKVAGRIPLPPRFAFGAWWSRYWDYSADELKQLVKEFKEHDVPLDVLVVDMGWHLDGWTGYTWNPKFFPDPDGFLKWVHEQGLKVTLNLHPAEGVGKQEKQFGEMCQAMGLDPAKTERVPFDCADRRFVEAYFNVLHHPLEKQGVDFWWLDWQQGKGTKIDGLDPLRWLNYSHWMDMERRAEATGNRPLLFSRWGGLGNHRYQIGFSGDTYSTWRSLAFQPYFTATAGNVGYAYWSHDIGGHMPGKVDPELYVRWLQWGALSPIMRTHTTQNPNAERRIWEFPKEYFEAGRKAYQLRYELIPYIYTAARQCYDTGVPLCRPLYLEWPEEEEAYKHGGEYMFGDELLVAPVTEPCEPVSGCAMMEVWLPPGKWTNWFTGRTYEGAKTIPLAVPLDEIPIFVRDGGVVVTQSKMQRSNEKPVDPIIVNIFPGTSHESLLYEDDGQTGGYAEQDFQRTTISHRVLNGKQKVKIDPMRDGRPPVVDRGIHIRLFDFGEPFGSIPYDGGLLERIELHNAVHYKNLIGWFQSIKVMGPELRLPTSDTRRMIELNIDGPTKESQYSISGHRGLLARAWKADRYCMDRSERLKAPLDYPERGDWIVGAETYATSRVPVVAFSALNRTSGDSKLGSAGRVIKQEVHPRKVFALLSGLYWKFCLREFSENAQTLQVECRVVPTLGVPSSLALNGSVRFSPDGRFMAPGEGEKEFHGLSEDKPVSLTMRIENKYPLETTVVRAEIEIKNEGLNFTIPLEKIILPSINAWWIAGPFQTEFAGALAREFPQEKQPFDHEGTLVSEGGKSIKWKQYKRQIKQDELGEEFFVDFKDVFGHRVNDCVVYGFTYLESPEELDAVLALGSDDGAAVWLNDKEVFRRDMARSYTSKDDHIPVHLTKGDNSLLVKVAQGGGDGGFCVHVEDASGKPLTKVKARLDR